MQSINTLNRIIYGRSATNGQFEVLALSGDLTEADAKIWRSYVSLDPLPGNGVAESQAVGLFNGPDQSFLLARVHRQHQQQDNPVYEYVLLSRNDLQGISGNIRTLLELIDEPIPTFESSLTQISPLPLPTQPTWTVDKRLIALSALLSEYGKGDMSRLLALLGAMLDERHLMIRDFAGSLAERIDLVQGLMLLLPAMARPDITFSTHVEEPQTLRPRIVFSRADPGTRLVADFAADIFPDLESVRSPFITSLEAMWSGDIKDFVANLRAMELMTTRLMPGRTLEDGLNSVAERLIQDNRVMAGEVIPIEDLKAILTGDTLPTGELRERYVTQLLDYVLETRDREATQILTRYMDLERSLNETIHERLTTALDTHPDAVYYCVRTRLSQGVDDDWIPLLHAAAVCALQVAINDSDTETLVSWLKLIAREPDDYQLTGVVEQGLQASRPRTHDDGDLGFQLLLFTVKRVPEAIDLLLQDEELLEALPETASRALYDFDPDAITALAERGREIYLVAIARSLDAHMRRVFTAETMQRFWAFYTDEASPNLPEKYQAKTLLHVMLNEGFDWLSADALLTLLTLMLFDGYTDLVRNTLSQVAEKRPELLPEILHQSERDSDEIISLVGTATTGGHLSQQQALDTYVQILVDKEWDAEYLPLAEQVARLLQQNQALKLPVALAWKLLYLAAEPRTEFIAKVATRLILEEIERIESERQLTELLRTLLDNLQWSQTARLFALNWWRDFIRHQSLVRLQQLDGALDGNRALEDPRRIVQTTIALRKMLGKRSLEDFADAIGTAFTILQALSDSFDPLPKHPIRFDPDTVRYELNKRQEELTPDEQRVLAKNLKELGSLIVSMAEHRSRAPLMRREGELDRQLMTGGHQPQSAIDTMKWLSGYLNGVQGREESEDS